jgi:hypothetical protein
LKRVLRGAVASLLVAACLIAATLRAAAQDTSLWSGDAGLLPVSPAQLNAGDRCVGDVLLDVELARSRTGRIASDITLLSDQHGEVVVPAETLVVANRETSIMVGGGQPARTIYGGIEWCTVTEAPRICIAEARAIERLFARAGEPAPPPFVYTEYSAPARLSGRIWRGEAPAIREERVEFEPTTRKQLIIHEITANGVFFTLRTIHNGQNTDVAASAPLAYGTRFYDSRTFAGVAFQLRRTGRGRIEVEALAPPAE